jgi:hypothetical protein
MLRRVVVLASLVVSLSAAGVAAQQMKVYRYNDRAASRFEVVPFGGYVWSMEKDFYYGAAVGVLDFKESGFYGVSLDVGVHPGSQVRLMYRRQDTEAVFRGIIGQSTTEAAIEYWHIGGITGMQRGNVLPYFLLTLGGTRYLTQGDDVWKFSMIFGLGAKIYAQGKFGLQIQGGFPFTFVDGGGSISCGGGGCFTSIGGSGLGQIDVSGGIVIGL